jgi:uncharacterized membrane protein
MTQLLIATTNALHALATAIFIGYYLVLSLIYLPDIGRPELGGGAALGRLSKSSRRWQYIALFVLALTGVYLTIADSRYAGIGNFNSTWALLMLVKHIVILAMLAIGFWANVVAHLGQALRSNPDSAPAMARYRRYCTTMAICGVLVLALTAIAQVE